MIEIVRSVSIRRDPTDCFELLADVERFPEWQRGTGIRRVVVRGDDPMAVGIRFRLESRFAVRRRVWVDAVLCEFEPPTRFAYRSSDWRNFALRIAVNLVQDVAGTRVEWSTALETPRVLRPLGPLIAREIGHRTDVDLAGLRAVLEA